MQTKRKRLPSGKFITVRLIESSAEDLAKAKADHIWKTSDGRLILPKDMELKHLVNCMRVLEGRDSLIKLSSGLTPEQSKELTARLHPIYLELAAELGRRMRRESPEPEQDSRVSRAFDLD